MTNEMREKKSREEAAERSSKNASNRMLCIARARDCILFYSNIRYVKYTVKSLI